MKVSITFSELEQDQAYDLFTYAKDHYGSEGPWAIAPVETEPSYVIVDKEASVEHLVGAKAQAEAYAAAIVEDAPARSSRRKDIPGETTSEAKPKTKSKNGRRTTAKEPSKTNKANSAEGNSKEDATIDDQTLMTAASWAASKITTNVVMALLEEYGTGNVSALKDDQRIKFLAALRAKVAEADLSDEIPF